MAPASPSPDPFRKRATGVRHLRNDLPSATHGVSGQGAAGRGGSLSPRGACSRWMYNRTNRCGGRRSRQSKPGTGDPGGSSAFVRCLRDGHANHTCQRSCGTHRGERYDPRQFTADPFRGCTVAAAVYRRGQGRDLRRLDDSLGQQVRVVAPPLHVPQRQGDRRAQPQPIDRVVVHHVTGQRMHQDVRAFRVQH